MNPRRVGKSTATEATQIQPSPGVPNVPGSVIGSITVASATPPGGGEMSSVIMQGFTGTDTALSWRSRRSPGIADFFGGHFLLVILVASRYHLQRSFFLRPQEPHGRLLLPTGPWLMLPPLSLP